MSTFTSHRRGRGGPPPMLFIFCLVSCSALALLPLPRPVQSAEISDAFQVFKTEILINKNDLDSGLYEGMVRGRRKFGSTQEPHGFGVINYYNDDKFSRKNYTGQWREGTRHGNGTTFFNDGSYYVGQYVNGTEEGEGKVHFPNGDVVEGEFSAGQINGHAVVLYHNGDRREGFFLSGAMEGQVIFIRANGETFIELWKEGEKIEDHQESEILDERINDALSVEKATKVTTESPVERRRQEEKAPDEVAEPVVTKIRTVARSGNIKQRFAFPGGRNAKSVAVPQGGDEGSSFASQLGQEVREGNRHYLMAVFLRANGPRRR